MAVVVVQQNTERKMWLCGSPPQWLCWVVTCSSTAQPLDSGQDAGERVHQCRGSLSAGWRLVSLPVGVYSGRFCSSEVKYSGTEQQLSGVSEESDNSCQTLSGFGFRCFFCCFFFEAAPKLTFDLTVLYVCVFACRCVHVHQMVMRLHAFACWVPVWPLPRVQTDNVSWQMAPNLFSPGRHSAFFRDFFFFFSFLASPSCICCMQLMMRHSSPLCLICMYVCRGVRINWPLAINTTYRCERSDFYLTWCSDACSVNRRQSLLRQQCFSEGEWSNIYYVEASSKNNKNKKHLTGSLWFLVEYKQLL